MAKKEQNSTMNYLSNLRNKECDQCGEVISSFNVKCDLTTLKNAFCSKKCLEKFKEDRTENKIKVEDSLKPIISFKGMNGKIELYTDFVRFDRGTFMGFLNQGLKGKKDIYFHNITSIQIKKPGVTVGYLQLSIPGGNESQRGVFGSPGDENTITFQKVQYEKALKIKECIERKIKSKHSGSSSTAEEIEKLHSLIGKGIISKKEFEAKKKQILEI